MRKRNIILASILIMIILGFNIYCLTTISDKTVAGPNINLITETYDVLKTDVEEFESSRKEVHDNVFQEILYEDMENQYKEWQSILKDYEQSLETLISNSSYMGDTCFHENIILDIINQKCDSYKEIYEISINYFVQDIKEYNLVIEEYNEWLDKNEKSGKLETYSSINYSEYADYNNDGVYEGVKEL